jgi:hypothetical protein
LTTSHYGVQVRIFIDSVGNSVQEGLDRSYSVRLLETGSSFTDLNANKTYLDPMGFVGLETIESMRGHSASLSLVVGRLANMLKARMEAQDAIRIEISTGSDMTGFGSPWRCAFDGFISSISWTETSTPQGYSWKLQIHADGLNKVFQQGWLNWRMATTAGAADFMTRAGQQVLANLERDNLFTPPQKFIGMLMNYAVSDLMGLTGRDGIPIRIGSYWQLGNFTAPSSHGGTTQIDTTTTTQYWVNAMGLCMTAALYTYLQTEGPLWNTVVSLSEPTLHELFVTYLPKGGSGTTEIPTVVFRPIPFPGPETDPAATSPALSQSGQTPQAPAGVSYPDDSEWNKLVVLKLGGSNGPAPISVSASKQDGERKNMFVWSLASALDGNSDAFVYKGALGYWLDTNSLHRYGFSSEQVTTSVFDRTNLDWLAQQIPRVLARVAYQKAPLPYLWTHQRSYPLLPGARPGTVLEDTTDNVCGYITSVSHQIQSSPTGFRAATTLTVERVLTDANGVNQGSYPGKVREYLTGLTHCNYTPSSAERAIHEDRHPEQGKGPFIRSSPVNKSTTSYGLTMSPGGGLTAIRRCGMHKAVDYRMGVGTPLYAPIDGVILSPTPGWQPAGAGNYVKFKGVDGSIHIFAHLQSACTLASGTQFKRGDLLGVSGNTGHTTGPHLHWQVYYTTKDRALDPIQWLTNGGSPQ